MSLYTTGTATFTAGSTAVTGTGTAWNTSMVGAQIIRNGLVGHVAEVGSPTALTLAQAALAGMAGTGAYAIDLNTSDTATDEGIRNQVATLLGQLSAVQGPALSALLASSAFVRSTWDATTQAEARTDLGLGALATLASVSTAQIANNAVNNTKIADMASARLKGRATAGTGDPEDLDAAQVRTIIGTDARHPRYDAAALLTVPQATQFWTNTRMSPADADFVNTVLPGRLNANASAARVADVDAFQRVGGSLTVQGPAGGPMPVANSFWWVWNTAADAPSGVTSVNVNQYIRLFNGARTWVRQRVGSAWGAWIEAPDNLAQLDLRYYSTGANGASGWFRLPSLNTIVQYGTAVTPVGGLTLTFPTAFPTACRSVVASAAFNADVNMTMTDLTTTSCSAYGWLQNGTSAGVGFNWIAIGH